MRTAAAKLRLLATITVAASCLLAIISEGAWATYPGRAGAIVFNLVHLDEGAPEPTGGLYLLDAPGKQPQQLTDNPWDYNPSFAPSGKRLVFRRINTPDEGLQVLNLETGAIQRLTIDGADTEPAFGRHGQIAFSRFSDKSQSYDIFLRTPGGSLRRLTSDPGNEGDPAFTPDGKRIVFYRDHSQFVLVGNIGAEEPEPDGLYAIDTDGADLDAVGEIESPWSFDISPNGRRLAFARIEQVPEISTMSLITGRTNPIQGEAMFPTYSPGGNQIAYSNHSGLWIRSVVGTGRPERILPAEYSNSGVGDLLIDSAWQPLPPPPRYEQGP